MSKLNEKSPAKGTSSSARAKSRPSSTGRRRLDEPLPAIVFPLSATGGKKRPPTREERQKEYQRYLRHVARKEAAQSKRRSLDGGAPDAQANPHPTFR